jgi:hypothetical protein
MHLWVKNAGYIIRVWSFSSKERYWESEGLVLRPGFEPGSVTREATILDRTILPERAQCGVFTVSLV